MKNILKNRNLPAILAVVVLLFVAAGKVGNNYFEVSKNLDILTSIVKEVNTYYVDEVNPGKLIRTGIDAMLTSLDPYTTYYSESEIEDYRYMTTGEYGGIGAMIGIKSDTVMVTEPYEGFPADLAGLRAGDKLLEIDDKSVIGKTTGQVSDMLKGQPNTEVKLKVLRPGEKSPAIVKVTRKEIKISNVPYYGMLEDGIGYIRFSAFKQNAGKEVKDAFNELRKNNDLKGIIIDVRGNPGGLLNEAVNVVNIFLSKGELVVSTRGKIDEWSKEYKTNQPPVDTDIPLVVLTSRSSASASEIVSGAIQDNDRGVIIGQQTFGKGLVQTTRPLTYNTQMKITTAKYYIPSGRCIQALDYASRDDEGAAVKIPDSLISEFSTAGGRKVYDGCGITPDIKVEPKQLAQISKSLLSKRHIFDYATHYRLKNESIPQPEKFALSDAEFEDFVKWLNGKEYDYKTNTESALEDFKEKAKKEQYYASLENEFANIAQKLEHNKEEDLRTHKEEVKILLEQEIVSRYYYQTGRLKEALETDMEVKEALKVLGNKQEYNKILSSAK